MQTTRKTQKPILKIGRNRPDRTDLRARVAASGLTDGVRAARELEDAYAAMWRRWSEAR